MALRKEFIRLLATKVVAELIEKDMIEIPMGFDLVEPVYQVMEAEMNIEDKVNDDVRALLTQYAEHMRQNNISYQEMFKMIKNKLVRERKVIL